VIVSRIGAWLASRVAPLVTLGAAGAASGYIGTVDPHLPGHYPACPVLRYGGVLCPGCGGLRSVHALLHGDVPGAVGANLVVVGAAVILAAAWTVWFVRPVRAFSVPGRYPRAAGVVVLVFTIVRNLPFGAALTP
jgi:Protein of unknown function (DUF2752)